MAAQTIKAQVEELIGSTSVASLNDWAGDAVNKLILILPYDHLFPFTTIESVRYSGTYADITAKNKRIFEISRNPSASSTLNRVCVLITPEEYEGQFSDPDSMYYPTDYDPKATIYEDSVKVLPAIAGMVVKISKIDLVTSLDTSATSISILPYECEYMVVLDLAQKVGMNKIDTIVSLISTALANEDIELANSYEVEVRQLIILINGFEQKYYDLLKTQFGIDLQRKENAK